MIGKSLRLSARVAAALGFLSISLTGEIAPAWITVIWSAWLASFLLDRQTEFQAAIRRFETAAVLGMIGLLFVDFFIFHNTLFIAVSHFLLFFQIVKLAGEKARKDCLQIFLVSFFQILAACTLSVDAWHAAVLLLFIPTAAAALFWNQMERERAEAGPASDPAIDRRWRRMAAGIAMAALPANIVLTAVVFILFPRLSLNASLPGFGAQRMGYADQVNLAQTGSLKEDASVVLWLTFPKREDQRDWDGYLRGDVLGAFDGRRWSVFKAGRARLLAPDSNGMFFIRPYRAGARVVHETITLADPSASTLFTSGRPMRVLAPLPSLLESEEGALHWTVNWRRPLRYEVIAEPTEEAKVYAAYLERPAISLRKIQALADEVAGNGSPTSQALNLKAYLRDHYKYSTDFGDRVAENPIEHFLFVRRQGTCGHFASALALMLRLRGIPSRMVAGYYKGEWNEPAQCYVVRERDAHAWVEAYIKGKGWITLDPTPLSSASAPSRPSLSRLAMEYWDYLSYQWNRLVIQYDLYAQVKAIETIKTNWWPHVHLQFKRLRFGSHALSRTRAAERRPLPWKTIVLFFTLSAASISLLRKQLQPEISAPIRFYHRFLHRMARAGLPKWPQETGWEFAERLAGEKPQWKELAYTITQKYYLLRYGKGVL